MDYNKDKLVTLEEFSKNEREHYHGCHHTTRNSCTN